MQTAQCLKCVDVRRTLAKFPSTPPPQHLSICQQLFIIRKSAKFGRKKSSFEIDFEKFYLKKGRKKFKIRQKLVNSIVKIIFFKEKSMFNLNVSMSSG